MPTPSDADRTERLRRWFAVQEPSTADPEAAFVVAEADAVSREALEYADLIRVEAETLAVSSLAARPVPQVGLDDLLIATQVVVDMCQALHDDDTLSDAQHKTVDTVLETAKPLPDMIRQAIAGETSDSNTPADASSGTSSDTSSGASSGGVSGGGSSTLP